MSKHRVCIRESNVAKSLHGGGILLALSEGDGFRLARVMVSASRGFGQGGSSLP